MVKWRRHRGACLPANIELARLSTADVFCRCSSWRVMRLRRLQRLHQCLRCCEECGDCDRDLLQFAPILCAPTHARADAGVMKRGQGCHRFIPSRQHARQRRGLEERAVRPKRFLVLLPRILPSYTSLIGSCCSVHSGCTSCSPQHPRPAMAVAHTRARPPPRCCLGASHAYICFL